MKEPRIIEKISVPCYSLTPHRLSLFNRRFLKTEKSSDNKILILEKEKVNKIANIYGDKFEVEKRYHNFEISEAGRKRMILKINWLYFLAKSRNKKTSKGLDIFNFKINFLTFTLPSKQMHPTSDITKNCFNQILTELRESYNLENFVWRLEFQKNGNVHYHLVTDVYIDYYQVLKKWNRIIGKLGYTQAYKEKHVAMSLNDYYNEYHQEGKDDFLVLKERYARGRASSWSIPNSVDVKAVAGSKKIAFYISKYFSKKEKTKVKCNSLDNMGNSMGLRLWFCSRSLSKLDKVSDFIESSKFDLLNIVTAVKDTLEVVHDYCVSYFFSFASLLNDGKRVIHELLYGYAMATGYKPNIV